MNYTEEQYEIKYGIQNESGYWKFGEKVVVRVAVANGKPLKRHHNKAKRIFKVMMPNAKITNVSYI